jgi:hypothetical protein
LGESPQGERTQVWRSCGGLWRSQGWRKRVGRSYGGYGNAWRGNISRKWRGHGYLKDGGKDGFDLLGLDMHNVSTGATMKTREIGVGSFNISKAIVIFPSHHDLF